MPRLTTIIALLLLSAAANAQNIYSALHFKDDSDYKTTIPKKIEATNIFYNHGGKDTKKEILTFDATGMPLTEERYDKDGVLNTRFIYTNDTTRKLCVSDRVERWHPTAGHQVEYRYYTYDDANALTEIVEKSAAGIVTGRTKISRNEKGFPAELTTYSGNGQPYGTETAQYFYDQNKVVTAVLSKDGTPLSTDTMKISFVNAHLFPEADEAYNPQGDLLRYTSKKMNGSVDYYECEYEYDTHGNCTEKKIYLITKRNGKSDKRKMDRVFKKEYTY